MFGSQPQTGPEGEACRTLQDRTEEMERRLRDRDRELAALTENIPGGMHQCRHDADFTLLSVSQGFLALFGYTREELRTRFRDCFAEMIYPGDRQRVAETIREQLERGDTIELEYRVRRKDGSLPWIMDKGKLAPGPDGAPCFYCLLLDVTRERAAREELRLSVERHQIILDQTTDIIFEWEIRRDTLTFSSNWFKKFGYEPIQQNISRGIPFSPNIHPEDMPAFVKIMRDTAAGKPYSETEFRIRDSLGAFTWCRIRATAQYDAAGAPVKAVGVILDIDAEKKQRQQLQEQARRDALTGLYNKAAARQAVEELLERAGQGVLLILDLDNFKAVNDRYGHMCGDSVLSDVAGILSRQFRKSDVVARIGGDEFLAALPGAGGPEAERKAQAVIGALRTLSIFGGVGRVSCSMGAALWPEDAGSFPALYRCADLALYQAKSRGKGTVAFYDPSLSGTEPGGQMARSSINAVIDSDAGEGREKLGLYCFRILYQAIEPKAAVEQVLEIVGQAYDVSRVYIVESSKDGLTCSSTFEWCGVEGRAQTGALQGRSCREDLEDYLENFNANGIFYCGDTRKLRPELCRLLSPRGVRSLLQCAVMDDGQVKGYVGFDECRENRRWTQAQIETLTLVANVLSTFLLKLRLKERLAELEGPSE